MYATYLCTLLITIVHLCTQLYTYLTSFFICKHRSWICRQVLHLAPALWAFRAARHPFLEWLVDANCSGLTIEVNPLLTSANPWRTSLSRLPPARSKYISQSQSMEICRKDKVKMVHSSSPTGKRSTTCPNCFEAAKGLPATNHLVNTAPWT